MRRPPENKSAIPATGNGHHPPATPGACPYCGRQEGAGVCRPVPMGWFCQSDGLVEDQSRRIHPTPDPIHEAVLREVSVLAALTNVKAHEEAFAAADEVWLGTLRDLSEARIGDQAQFIGGSRTTDLVYGKDGQLYERPRDRRREARLVETEREAKRSRDAAGELLAEARVKHQEAVRRARWELTTPTQTPMKENR